MNTVIDPVIGPHIKHNILKKNHNIKKGNIPYSQLN